MCVNPCEKVVNKINVRLPQYLLPLPSSALNPTYTLFVGVHSGHCSIPERERERARERERGGEEKDRERERRRGGVGRGRKKD